MSSQREWTPPQEFDEYRLVRLLGKGTMGQVYLAHDRVLDRPVAVKFVTTLDPSARERFLVEARAAARLQHPNVMAIYRVGELDQRPFLINEYIRGKSLAELELPLPWRRALELGLGLARGLAAAHRQGVLHRDIKLANAMVSERGEVKLLDFSLAKIEGVPLADQQKPRRDLDNPTTRFDGPGQKTLLQRPGVDRHGDTLLAGQAPQPSVLDSSAAVRITQMGMPVQAVPPSAVTRRFDREFADDDFESRAELTADGTLLGTPNYMAPELWRAEPASRRSDVYALGVLLYTLCSGRPPHEAKNALQLASRVQDNDPRPLLERCPAVDPRFAAVIDRCIRRDPGERWASGEELRAALEALVPVGREGYVPTGNPYRGLQAFEAEHRELFFGRAAEVQAVVDRVRAQPFVLVAGDSGVGKSSLCRAGVLPLIGDGGLDAERSWHITSITPGRRPAAALIAALAGGLGLDEESFMGHAKVEPDALDRALRRELGRYRGRVIFIDQLEELVTIARPVEAALAARLLARIAAGIDGVRLLATARGDFLTRIAQLPGFGDELARSLYFLSPLSEEGMRLAIVGPAQLQHVSFESETLVDRLVVAGVEGSLPLLQFALAELWEARPPPGDMITAAALDKIGGVSGALARHADGVLSRLGPRERKAARTLLLRLVTIDSTRAKLTEDELVNGDADHTALEALIAARLVVARDITDGPVYELAHEALIHGWVTLQVWLEEEKEARLAHHRLAHAASEWERVGKPRDGLWGEHQLAEARLIESQSLRPREIAFLTASHDRLRRRRRARRALLTAAPLAAVLAFSGVRYAQQVDIDHRVDAHARSAAAFLREARKHDEEVERHRLAAFAKFDARDRRGGEQSWALARAGAPSVDRLHNRAARELETALSLDADRPEIRALLADVLYERALFAERNHRTEQADDFLSRLQLYDDGGERMQRWTAPARLHIDSTPTGAHVAIAPYERLPDGAIRPGEAKDLGATPVVDLSLPAGSYIVTLDAPGYAPVRYPVLLARGERLELGLELLAAADVPPDFVYVAAGRSLFGTPGDDDLRRDFFTAVPQHEVYTEGYLISAHEVTYAQWIDYLESLDDEQRAARMTKSDGAAFQQAPALVRLDDGGWQIAFQVGNQLFTARAGDSIRFPRRRHHTVQDWLRFPVTGITWDDARAYLQWLDATGRVPGARPCTEVEWERAARGADARRFPTGDDVRPDEANIDETFARDLTAMGPTEVGSFAASESPFGLYDMTGNVWEWVASSVVPGEAVARGGAFFFAKLTGAAVNRNGVEASFRDGTLGLRVCATPRFRT